MMNPYETFTARHGHIFLKDLFSFVDDPGIGLILHPHLDRIRRLVRNYRMVIERLNRPWIWPTKGSSNTQSLCRDWHGQPLDPPARFRLIEDPNHLWLVASRDSPATPHPEAHLGAFQAELWRYDVAELFIRHPHGPSAHQPSYLEFNLSPNGAWWMAGFRGPRESLPLRQLPEIQTHAEINDSKHWCAALGIPLDWLKQSVEWDEPLPCNVTFILDSQAQTQRFLSSHDLGTGEPDFHRPDRFLPPRWVDGC